jgi:hypothetical protein
MKTAAIIGVVQDDGRILAARVAQGGGRQLRRTLSRNYNSRLKATMLVSLGSLVTVGATPTRSVIADDQTDPALVDPCGFEIMRGTASNVHLFDGMTWDHWSDTAETVSSIMIEED